MFGTAASRMGYQVAVWDPDVDAPAHRFAAHSFAAPFSDMATLERFARSAQAVTFEWENVPADLCERLEQSHRVRPGSAVLRLIQDRIEQKRFLASCELPVAPFAVLSSPDDVTQAVRTIGFPAICKTARSGYDGKGQWVLRQEPDLVSVRSALQASAQPGSRWILERLVNYERELSLIVVRGGGGEFRTYPVVENRHEHGILRLTLVPAAVSSEVAARAADFASRAVAALNGVGVFCVELFQMSNGDLLINELAPRPHNSGHYTMDACSVSQFEQQVRVLCGLPLGEVRLLSPAAMVNLIGDDVRHVTGNGGPTELLAIPGAVLHLYGKRMVRPGRKMGHVTFLADRTEVAADRALQLVKQLA
jgi:5-(carboxyamino)imidazole ribonucleotide synthase